MKISEKSGSNPLMLGLIMASIIPMALGLSFGITLLLLTSMTILAIYINKGLHKLDLIYIGLAYLILLGYLFPEFVNLGS